MPNKYPTVFAAVLTRFLSTDTLDELNILWKDGDTLGVDCAQVAVLI